MVKKLSSANLDKKAKELIALIKNNPFQKPLPYSRRINIQHRIVYEVKETEKRVSVSRMWTLYGK